MVPWVYDDALSHDVALVEGIRSPVGRKLTRSYRWINFERLGLVRQPKTPSQAAVTVCIVNADLTPDEFHREWRKISWILRTAFAVGAPIYGL